jgi:cytochrome o ubiquinol oxidase subunit 1
MKQNGAKQPQTGYTPIHMPRSSASGILIAGVLTVFGFAMIWHIWWLALVTFIGSIAMGIAHTFNYDRDYYVPADEVAKIEAGNTSMAPAE